MRKLIFLMCILLWSGLATAGFDEALAAYKKGDFKMAANGFKELSMQGNAQAQYILGLMYRQGQGVPRDYTQAYEWLSLATLGESDAIKFRNSLVDKMTASQIEEAQHLAQEWTAQHKKYQDEGTKYH